MLVGGTDHFWLNKRISDILGSVALLPTLGALALLLLVLNLRLNPGPLFFYQHRMGRFGKRFVAIKFRTMLPEAPGKQVKRGYRDPLEHHRITPFGRFLRQTRIDELPQIINVLRGEMSLIGPRPDYYDHALEYLEAIPEYRARHAIRPGISGLAQVTLGYAIGLDQTRAKAHADLTYIRNACLWLDIKIFWLTLVTVTLRRGI
ncbi:hypothetical protein STA1M1_31110 [Sinisalibacter aestuarii]|uniref:Bacterial sugar transferase domain-containing protein n=1 Tax=Sinisalibacter aestuarii TaxID=2949426 RepID=A0ABQ5LYQ7_9RHOB|nr:hypothetical protein STA1M1_31110 [Sinisalibacter aestuarii]